MDVARESLLNLSHLDHLGEEVEHAGVSCRIVHIYAAAPDYDHAADPEEGTACVDDVARAAVLYLRHFELTSDGRSRTKAEALLRFVLYMQTPEGLFFNFVVNSRLEINRTHRRSRADAFGWWASRAVWALGTGARVLRDANPSFAQSCREAIRKTFPHLDALLGRYPETVEHHGRTIPVWLVSEDGSDATSELLLGLVAFNQVEADVGVQAMITRFAEGIALMRYGSMNTFPYGCHASNRGGWHKYGNSQTQALAEAGIVTSAKQEADQFYPRLLIEGFLHSIAFDDLHAVHYLERIAYGVRCVAVGLVRLFEATRDERYLTMAGLAAAWFTGNNEAGKPMYDPATGRGYDGLQGEGDINYNAGAESTIEAAYTILEVEQYALAKRWMQARGAEPERVRRDGIDYLYRVFEDANGEPPHRTAVVMNLTRERLEILEGEALEAFLAT